MIRPLRRRHLWMIVAIGTITAVLAVAGWLARPEPAVQNTLPDDEVAQTTGPSHAESGAVP